MIIHFIQLFLVFGGKAFDGDAHSLTLAWAVWLWLFVGFFRARSHAFADRSYGRTRRILCRFRSLIIFPGSAQNHSILLLFANRTCKFIFFVFRFIHIHGDTMLIRIRVEHTRRIRSRLANACILFLFRFSFLFSFTIDFINV